MGKKEKEKNPMVDLAGTLGGIFLVIVIMVLIFASHQAWILAPIVGAFAIMGIFLGYFISKKK